MRLVFCIIALLHAPQNVAFDVQTQAAKALGADAPAAIVLEDSRSNSPPWDGTTTQPSAAAAPCAQEEPQTALASAQIKCLPQTTSKPAPRPTAHASQAAVATAKAQIAKLPQTAPRPTVDANHAAVATAVTAPSLADAPGPSAPESSTAALTKESSLGPVAETSHNDEAHTSNVPDADATGLKTHSTAPEAPVTRAQAASVACQDAIVQAATVQAAAVKAPSVSSTLPQASDAPAAAAASGLTNAPRQAQQHHVMPQEARASSTESAQGNTTESVHGNSTLQTQGNTREPAQGNSTLQAQGTTADAQANTTKPGPRNRPEHALGKTTGQSEGSNYRPGQLIDVRWGPHWWPAQVTHPLQLCMQAFSMCECIVYRALGDPLVQSNGC